MNYTYVNSQIKVIEENILDMNDFLTLSKTPKSDFLKALVDLGYGNYANSLEEIINNELSSVKQYLDEVSPNRTYTDLFFLINDAVNIKYLYKLRNFNLRDANMFMARGNYSEDELRSAILDNDYSKIKKEYVKLFNALESNAGSITNPRTLSGVIDSTIYNFILTKIRFTINNPLNKYFKTLIDFSNVLSFIRIKNLNWSYSENYEMFIDGGYIDLKVIQELYDLDETEIVNRLKEYYNEKLSEILKRYFNDRDLHKLEISLNKLHLSLMKEFQEDAFGIGIILYYYLKKLAEANNIRYIYASANIDVNDLLVY